jgi:hypothetical protein
VNDEKQSEQPDKLPTASNQSRADRAQEAPAIPEPRSGGQTHQAPTTSDGDKIADRQTSGSRLKRTLRNIIKAIFGPIGTLIAALLGFLLGIAATQVSDYIKRADNCAEALEQYATGVAGNIGTTYNTEHDPNASDEKKTEVGSRYVAQVDAPHDKALVVCPLDLARGTQYLDANQVKEFHANYEIMDKCEQWVGCPEGTDNLLALAEAIISSSKALAKEAQEVSSWGLVRRANYVVMHSY